MIKKKLKYFAKKLEEEKVKLIQKLTYEKDQFNDLNRKEIGDIVDVAFNMYEKDRAIQMSESDKRTLVEINIASRKVLEGNYGICSCGEEIDENRLEAIPWTNVCVKCMKKKRKV